MQTILKNDYILWIPKQGFAPMLLLEWIADFENKDIRFTIRENDRDKEMFSVYLFDACLSHYESLKEYIESNS